LNSLTVNAASGATEVVLGDQLLVRDIANAKTRLREALDHGLPIRLHAGRLERVDTAALQLLLAFLREAETRGCAVEWGGDNAILASAIECLGLRDALRVP
jgi:ABC-type transporter Mla MlaB component